MMEAPDGVGMMWVQVADKVGPWYLFALEQFGVDRCMFCSNFPVLSRVMVFQDVTS
jgi:predicted TIM-barrel fold metal-dependent hydrolase